MGRLVRALRPAPRAERPDYVFESDGMATVHHSPFLEDDEFNARYAELRREWFPEADVDVRWRLWLLTTVARQCSAVPGDFAEFGVYRAGCAFMIFGTGAFDDSKRFYLYDTFAGIPAEELAESERAAGLAGAHADTSVDYVRGRLAPWEDRIEIVAGDVNETLAAGGPELLAFAHMDLNAAEPTLTALQFAYPRLAPGAMMVFDDYGWSGLEAQREVIDSFLSGKPEQAIALPTGQALLVKR